MRLRDWLYPALQVTSNPKSITNRREQAESLFERFRIVAKQEVMRL